MEKFLRIFLNVMAFYLVGDGLIHLLNTRLQSVVTTWPTSAISYATLLNGIYASFIFLAATLLFVAQKDIKKYKSLIVASSFWAIFHACLLIYLSTTQDFINKFSGFPSLYVWMPIYNQYLYFESFLALIYALIVFTWAKKK